MKNWKYISITVLLLSVFSFISCTNAIEETEPSSETGTYLIIKSDGISLSRSINPRVDEELGKLKNIVLYGTKTVDTDDTPITNGARRTLKSCASITELYNSQILLTDGAGKYTFELIGSFSPFNTMYYYDKNENVTIAENETNPVSFALAAVKSSTDYSEITGENGEHYGGINIKLSFDASKTNVSKVTVTVKTANAGAEETLVETRDLTISSSNSNSPKSVEYKREVSSTDANTGRIKTGTYRITFDFYWGTQVLNSIPYIVNVAYGLNTNFEDTIDLNEVYKITYNGNFGFQSNGVFSGETKVDYFSRKSDNIVLYLPYKANYVFDGWYDESDNIITYIPAGSTGNRTVNAHWLDMHEFPSVRNIKNNANIWLVDLYVTPAATYHYGNNATYGFATMDQVIEQILHTGGTSPAFNVKIQGTLSGKQSFNTNLNSYADFIILEGNSGATIDAGVTDAEENGAAISVITTSPVTIQNITVKGGKNTNSGTVKGGGIYVGSTATVILGDGALITGNTVSSGSGNGIYCDGTLKIKGSAVVEDDIYLASGKKLIIAGPLASGNTPIATITPAEYTAGNVVLEAESGSGVTLDADLVSRFSVPDADGHQWGIDTEGKLTKGANGGNGGSSNNNDFVTVAGGTFSTDGHVGTVENDNDYAAGKLTIRDLEVCSHLVTQYEYEQLMTYYGVVKSNSSLTPTETSESAKKSTPAYFVTWIDAIVYCNLRSKAEGLTPVYSLGNNDEITAAGSTWTTWGYIEKDGNGKYYYNQTDLESHNDISTYDLEGGQFSYDLSANGYRLPTTAEYQNIKTNNPDLISGGYDEWCQNYNSDYNRCMYDASEIKPVSDIYADTRENNLGFRVVRNFDYFVLTGSFTFAGGETLCKDDENRESKVFIAGNELSIGSLLVCNHEVTQGEYEQYCCYTGTKPSESNYGNGPYYPVYYVSWYDAIVYCNLRSKAEGLTPCYSLNGINDAKTWTGIKTVTEGGKTKYSCNYTESISAWDGITCDWSADGYRLPTSAEWEYAARGANLNSTEQTIYSGTDGTNGDLDNYAWHAGNSEDKTHPVKGKLPNALKLYDMTGNVSEICWDWHPADTNNTLRSVRSSGFSETHKLNAIGSVNPFGRYNYIGFRVVRKAPENP